MGPGCFYPGNGAGLRDLQVLRGASMGPGCFYPGNAIEEAEGRLEAALQWGRDVSIPEMLLKAMGLV